MHEPVSGRLWPAALILAGALVLLSGGCAELDRNAHAEALAAPAGLKREPVATGPFVLTAFVRITRADQPLTVYIEGDGLAWVSRREPSADPTPRTAIGLALAAADPAANVVYLARPCQFTPMEWNPACGVPYWTGKRLAPEVITSMNEAVSHFVAQVPGQRIHLAGYSGGGAVAILIAARRHDVASIRTVAGNLDSEFVNQLHHVSPMPESGNPFNFARQVATIPQMHYSGADDKVVPPEVARRFVLAADSRCVQTRTVPGMTHNSDWGQLWPALLATMPGCTADQEKGSREAR